MLVRDRLSADQVRERGVRLLLDVNYHFIRTVYDRRDKVELPSI
jgi:hypothetical protein